MQIEIAVSLIREILRSSFALLKLTFIFVDGRERSKINRVAASFHLASKNFWSTFSRLLLRLVVNFEKLQSLFIVPSVFLCRWNSFYFFLFICVYIYIHICPRYLSFTTDRHRLGKSFPLALLNLLPVLYLSRKLLFRSSSEAIYLVSTGNWTETSPVSILCLRLGHNITEHPRRDGNASARVQRYLSCIFSSRSSQDNPLSRQRVINYIPTLVSL